MRARLRLLGLFVALMLVAVACGSDQPAAVEPSPPAGEPEEPRELTDASLRTSWSMSVEWAGFLWAMEEGYYEQEGIELELLMGTGSGDVIPLVANKGVDFAFIDLSTMIRFRSEGMPVKSVGVIHRQLDFSTACWKDAGVAEPTDLEGKSILVTAGESMHQVWPAFVGETGIDGDAVTLRFADAGPKYTLFFDRRADCVLSSGSFFEARALENGVVDEVSPPLFWPDYGVSMLSQGIIAHEDTIAERPDIVQGVVSASFRAWEEVCADPVAGAELYLSLTDEGDDETAETELRAICLRTQAAPEIDPGTAFGPSGDEVWQNTIDMLTEFAELEGASEPSYYYTDEFVENMPDL